MVAARQYTERVCPRRADDVSSVSVNKKQLRLAGLLFIYVFSRTVMNRFFHPFKKSFSVIFLSILFPYAGSW